MRVLLAAMLWSLVVGCGLPQTEPEREPAPACDDEETEGNGVDDDCDPSTFDLTRIATAPTSGALALDGTVDVEGAGSDRVGAIAITDSAGTIEIDGVVLSLFVDDRIEWPELELTLHQVVAVASDRFVTAWLYCEVGALSWIYFGDANAELLDEESAAGACVSDDAPAAPSVSLPALTLPLPPLLPGYAVDGAEIHFDGLTPGAVVLGDEELVLWPYRLVDCSSGCGDPGWLELHSFLWDRRAARVAFGIVYFYLDPTLPPDGAVALVVGHTTPDLSDAWQGDWFFVAEFTVPAT